jgi:hypothetical protein
MTLTCSSFYNATTWITLHNTLNYDDDHHDSTDSNNATCSIPTAAALSSVPTVAVVSSLLYVQWGFAYVFLLWQCYRSYRQNSRLFFNRWIFVTVWTILGCLEFIYFYSTESEEQRVRSHSFLPHIIFMTPSVLEDRLNARF